MVNDNRFATGEQFRRGLATFSRLLVTSGAGFGMSEERSPEEIVRIGIQPVEPFMSNLDLLGARIEKAAPGQLSDLSFCATTRDSRSA